MRSAIVGCGGIAQVHAKCLNTLAENDKNLERVAVCDCKRAKAEEMAGRYGAASYGSLEEMLRCEDIDILHICTPHYLHTPMAVYTLDLLQYFIGEHPKHIEDLLVTIWEKDEQAYESARSKEKGEK